MRHTEIINKVKYIVNHNLTADAGNEETKEEEPSVEKDKYSV